MNEYEKLHQLAESTGVNVVSYPFRSERIKGLYGDGTIAISQNISTTAEKSCVLAEELGHYYTTTGDILDQGDTWNRKQEHRARLYGYNLRIGLSGLVEAYEHGCQNRYDVAEHLGVTEEYLDECIHCYREKYGTCTAIDNRIIFFIPTLMVFKLVEQDAIKSFYQSENSVC